MTLILGPEGILDEFGNPLKGPLLDEFGKPIKEMTKDEFIKELKDAAIRREELIKEVEKFLSFYFNERNSIDLTSIDEWIKNNPSPDKWFFIYLIELASEKRFYRSIKQHFTKVGANGGKAKNKPKAELKAWSIEQAKSLKIPDRDAARQLSARIPAHLAKVSTNAEQLIYRALLARHKAK